MTAPRARIWSIAVAVALAAGCSASIPKPPSGPRVKEPGVEVPFPPPAARVQTIPPQKKPNEVWVDGQWSWDGEVWAWTEGQWRVPPPKSYFTPWYAHRLKDGRLIFWTAAWRDERGRRIADPFGEASCPPLEEAPAP